MPKFNINLRDRIIIAAVILLTLLIPTGAYVLSLRAKTESSAQEYKNPVTNTKSEASTSSKLQDALNRLTQDSGTGQTSGVQTTTEDGTDGSGASDSQLVFGPTLGLSVLIQGRPLDNQSTQAFLGIAAGQPTSKPTYLLSFMVTIPASGAFDGISLSGLDSGATYTAYLKGKSQIATASAFVVKATPSNLGALNLVTGDVNEDNVIDKLDYNLVKALIGTTPSSSNWNTLYDFNTDNIINSWDLNIISANLGKIGASGAWYSYTPVATTSAITSGGPDTKIETGTDSATPQNNSTKSDGYWMFVPKI